jgi:hypothetical protein
MLEHHRCAMQEPYPQLTRQAEIRAMGSSRSDLGQLAHDKKWSKCHAMLDRHEGDVDSCDHLNVRPTGSASPLHSATPIA